LFELKFVKKRPRSQYGFGAFSFDKILCEKIVVCLKNEVWYDIIKDRLFYAAGGIYEAKDRT
jgi:hypothetical protein